MSYTHEIDGCLAATIGEHGLPEDVFRSTLAECGGALDWLRARHRDDALPLLRLPGQRDDLASLEDVAAGFREHFDQVLILGTGGRASAAKLFMRWRTMGSGRLQERRG